MSMRMASFSGLAVAVISLLGGARGAAAQQVVKLGEGETLTISGFISATLFSDRGVFGSFGSGQNAEFAAAPASQPGTNQGFLDGDVRNTRINFTFTAPPVIGKWAPKAVLESDFFGTFTSAPPFGDEQPQFRIRFAYVDLSNGRTTVRMGQYWSPFFGETPVSLTHIAFPLGYGASGKIGWRFPGIFLYHDLTTGAPVNVQLQLAAMKGSGPIVGPAPDTVGNVGSGEASGLPQLEALLNFTKKSGTLTVTGYVAGHLDWKDTTGIGAPGDKMTGSAGEVGANVTSGKFMVHGNFYYGKNIGQQFAHITQFTVKNVQGWGAWAQAGYDLDPHWSVFAYAGMDQPDAQKYNQTTGLTLARQLSHVYDGLIRYRAGRYAVGLEYFRSVMLYSTGRTDADQFALSTQYTF